jgi:hypothetical protein
MPSLYERITQTSITRGPCPPAYLTQLLGELYREKVDLEYAHEYMLSKGGEGFDSLERQELQDLIDTVDGPDRLQEIWDVLYMADAGAEGYNTAPELRERLGVPTRT